MPTTEPSHTSHRHRPLSRPSGPRSRELLNRRGHVARIEPPDALANSRIRGGPSNRLRFADLFAGMGGFHLAFAQIGAECVFACENHPTARQVYEANFISHTPKLFSEGHFAGDIAKVDPAAVPDHDVLTAGFPCQPFSVAGKRRGFDDSRGMLFFDIARIITVKRPAAFFLENVKGLLRHDHGQTFDIIRAVLAEDLGYSLHAEVVRACDFGVPQLRPRLFMVGFRDRSTPFSFPEPVPLTTTLSDVLGGRCERAVSRTLIASGHHKYYGERFNWAHCLVDGRVHRLTPGEALALQGFPPDFQLPDSYQAAMRLIGNSVAVPAVAATARQIAGSLGYAVAADSPVHCPASPERDEAGK